MKYRKCEICGFKSERKDGRKRFFMARFPLDEVRCKKWVKVTGNEDLANIPIEKLHDLKFVCGKHFRDKDFKKKKTQLKKTAVPSIRLTAEPLLDEKLIGFPCHLFREQQASIKGRFEDRVPENDSKTVESKTGSVAEQVPKQDSQTDKRQADHENIEPENDILSWEEQDEPEFIHEELENTVPEKDIFSWEGRKEPELIHEDEAEHTEVVPGDLSMYCNDEAAPVTTTQDDRTGRHEGFHCDNCNGDIVGYRYTCVQCSDLDLCVTCESRGAHSHHYMLRVPSPRPYNEIQTVLARIRMHLMKQLDPISGPDLDNDDVVSVKSEVKSEDEAEDVEDIEQVDTLAEDTVTSEAEEHSRLSSAASKHSAHSNSIVVLEEVVQDPDKTLKGKSEKLLRVCLPDNIESTLLSTAKRKNLEEVSGPVETIGSNQQTKRICYQPKKQMKKIILRDSKAILKGRQVTFVKLPPGALLKRGETVSLQIRPPKDPLTNATDSKS